MAPPRGRVQVTADPIANLIRLILHLKLKAAAFAANGSMKAAQDCQKAENALSIAVCSAVGGPPALGPLQLALDQETDASAHEVLQRIGQLLASVATCAETLGQRRQQMARKASWHLLQPVLRLLLWLLPEHVPQHPQLHQGPAFSRVSAAAQAPTAHQGSVKDQDPQTLSGSVDWKLSLGLAYARETVKPALYQALVPALHWFLGTSPLVEYPETTLEGFRLMEECLLWVALLRRLHNLAVEMEDDQLAIGTPAGLAGSSQRTSPGSNLLSEIIRDETTLLPLATYVIRWLQGRCWQLTQTSSETLPSRIAGVADQRKRAVCIAFASSFQPSLHLATFASSPFSILAQQLAGLLSGVLFRSLALKDNHWSACTALYAIYNETLAYMLPGGLLELSGAERAGYLQHLAHHVEMNLRGLMLTVRLLLGSIPPEKVLSQSWHKVMSSVCTTVQMLIARLSETAPHQMGTAAVQSPHYAAASQASQHRGLLGFFTDHNSQAHAMAQQQRQADQGLHSGWLQAACVAADAMHLLQDVYMTHQPLLSSGKQGTLNHQLLVTSVVNLLPWLRPSSPSDYMTGAATIRGWGVCLVTLSSMLDVVVSRPATDPQQEALPGDVLGLRVLLDELLPVLSHAALHVCHSSSSAANPQGTSGQPAPLQDTSAQPVGDPDALPNESLINTSPSQIPHPCNSSHAAPRVPGTAVESILLLLGASANLLCHSVSLAIGNKGAYSTLSRSPHPAAPIPPQDDLVAALSAVLVLATHLISGGPWWQEAKAHHPLVLIETLSLTAKSLIALTRSLLDAKERPEALWSFVATWPSLGAASQIPQSRCASSAAASSETTELPHPIIPAAAAEAEAATARVCDRTAATLQSAATPSATAAVASGKDGSLNDSMGAGEASDSSPRQQTCPSAQHTNITTFTSELVACLWELVADASIVGGAQGPAAWLPTSQEFLQITCGPLCSMLMGCVQASVWAIQSARQRRIKSGSQEGTSANRDGGNPGMESMPCDQRGTAVHGSPGGCSTPLPAEKAGRPTAMQRVLCTTSLALAVPWERLKAAASKLGPWPVEVLDGTEQCCIATQNLHPYAATHRP